jgi:hypothetical protein
MCKSLWGWTLECSKHVEDTTIKLKYECKKCAFCWFLLHHNAQFEKRKKKFLSNMNFYNFIWLRIFWRLNLSSLVDFSMFVLIRGVPLTTETSSSLIILTPVTILQRNRHTLPTRSFSFLTQRSCTCSNVVAMSSLVLDLLKKCRVW